MTHIPDYEAITVFLDGEEEANNSISGNTNHAHYQYSSFDSVVGAILIAIGVGFIFLLTR